MNTKAHQKAAQAFQDGKLDEAETLYRDAIKLDPHDAASLHLLGVIAYRKNNPQEAIDYLKQSVAADPHLAIAHSDLGAILRQQGLLEEALATLKEAVALQPDSAGFHNNVGNALAELEQHNEAVIAYRHAVRLKPDYPQAHKNLANALYFLGELEEAEKQLRSAIDLDPGYATAHLDYGNLLKNQNRLEEAVNQYQQTLSIDPKDARAHFNLGVILHNTGDTEQAIKHYQKATALEDDYEDAHCNLGHAFLKNLNFKSASEQYKKALDINPRLSEAHVGNAQLHLVTGDFSQGWEDYEWRNNGIHNNPRGFSLPPWTGEPLEGQTLLVHAEQGFGDVLQFIRYLPQVADCGAKIILEVPKPLFPILADFPNAHEVIVHGNPLPHFDSWIPLLSLPRIFKTNLASMPNDNPYVSVDPEKVSAWRTNISSEAFSVGLVWAGRPDHKDDHNRSLDLKKLTPLFDVETVKLYSLQVGDRATDIKDLKSDALIDLSDKLTDFAETAAAIENLDLVITVDTAVAHLAGALGKPVWMLLPYYPDWRWLLDREDTPWYPTMRLYRQPKTGDWESVIKRVVEDLKATSR